jgi:hypothetical protein
MRPIHWIAIVIALFIGSMIGWDNQSHLPIRIFRRTGEVQIGLTKIFADTITCTTGNGFSIDISPAGFSTVPRVQITAMRNTSAAISTPNVAIKSVSTTAIVVNVTEGNPNTTTILGIPVLSGAPTQFVATPSDVLLNVQAVGN